MFKLGAGFAVIESASSVSKGRVDTFVVLLFSGSIHGAI